MKNIENIKNVTLEGVYDAMTPDSFGFEPGFLADMLHEIANTESHEADRIYCALKAAFDEWCDEVDEYGPVELDMLAKKYYDVVKAYEDDIIKLLSEKGEWKC